MLVAAAPSWSTARLGMLAMEPSIAFTRMLEYSELMKMPW